MSLGGIGQPAASSNSVDSESLPSGSLSPGLIAMGSPLEVVRLLGGTLACRSSHALSKWLARPPGRGYIAAMQTAAETVQEHRLTLSEVMQSLVADGVVPKADADRLVADRR